MGSWGPGLFSDDVAEDVRASFRRHIADGLDTADASSRVLSAYADLASDPDDGPVIWLALAVTEWKLGCLETHVRDRAVEIIDSGADLKRWDDATTSDRRKRQRVLEQTRALLFSMPPPTKTVRRRFRMSAQWDVGDVLAYRLASGQLLLMIVVEHGADADGTSYPVVSFLDSRGGQEPSPDAIAMLEVRSVMLGEMKRACTRFCAWRWSARDVPPVRVVASAVPIPTDPMPRSLRHHFWWRDTPNLFNAAFDRPDDQPAAAP